MWHKLKKFLGIKTQQQSQVQGPYPGTLAYVDKDVKYEFINCSFKGMNADGYGPFRYRQNPDGTYTLTAVKLEGWSCVGPIVVEDKASTSFPVKSTDNVIIH
jgi:hypothetical protein